MTKLFQILYSSKSNKDFSLEKVNQMLEVARKNNSQNGLTGILLFRNGNFLQLIEGEKFNVYYTMKKIMDDNRHTNLTVLHESEVDSRLFSNWSMAFKTETESDPETDERLKQLNNLKPIKDNLELLAVLNNFFYQVHS